MNQALDTHCNGHSDGLQMALELSKKDWLLAFSGSGQVKIRRRRVDARNLVGLVREMSEAKTRLGLSKQAAVVSCYEAGFDGFWLHRFLSSHGVRNLVVDSASIEVNRRKRRAKTDRLDAGKLLKMLNRYERGERDVWSVVNPPSVEEEDHRQFQRELLSLKQERTRHINRINNLLATQGVVLQVDRHLLRKLSEARLWDGQPLPKHLRERLERESQRLELVDQQITEVERERAREVRHGEGPHVEQVQQLMLLKGIGPYSAWLFVSELFGWRQIRNGRELSALAGLAPTPYASGEARREQGISKAGNKRVRSMAVEISWLWLRNQPDSALSKWFNERFGAGGKRMRRIGIVALARRLLIELWRFLETGAIPEGAQLKSALT